MVGHLQNILDKLEEVIGIYTSSLDRYTTEQLRFKQNNERWSLGEVYDHVVYSAKDVYFPAVVDCTVKPEAEAGAKTAAGIEIFQLGEYPPTKAISRHIPKIQDDKQVLYEGFREIKKRAQELAPLVKNSLPQAKTIHPRLGALNAREWFELAGMHFRHHLQQKSELEKILGIGSSGENSRNFKP